MSRCVAGLIENKAKLSIPAEMEIRLDKWTRHHLQFDRLTNLVLDALLPKHKKVLGNGGGGSCDPYN